MERSLSLAWQSMVHISDLFFARLPNLAIGLIIFLIFVFVARAVKSLVGNIGRRARLDETLCHALGTIATVAVYIVGVLVTATVVFPSFSPAHLVAGLGITSVAVGFAFKDILENFFAGILLLWQKPFRIGDEIKTSGFEGMVQDIDIRSTRLKTHDGELVVVPNGTMLASPIVVLTGFERRRVKMTVPLAEGIPADQMRRTILAVLKQTKSVATDPSPAVYQPTPDGSLELYFWAESKQASVEQATDEVATAIQRSVQSKPTKIEGAKETANAA